MLNFAALMAQKAAGLRIDPFCTFNFLVEIDGIISGAFSEVSGLTIETEVLAHQEGGINDYVHQLPKGTKQSNLVLSRGLSDLDLFWGWYRDVINGTITRKDGMIMLFDSAMDLAMWWYFYQAYPIKWEGPTFQAYGSDVVAVEKITLAHHGLMKPGESQAWSASRILLKATGIKAAAGAVESAVVSEVEAAKEEYVDSQLKKAQDAVEQAGEDLAKKITEEAPTIVEHPTGQTKSEKESVTFQVVATGAGPLTYQWRKDLVAIKDATSSSYTIGSLTMSDAGAYSCVVTNDVGFAASDAAALVVMLANTPPTIVTHPVSQDKMEGDEVTFSVEAKGSAPLSYIWHKDGVRVSVNADSNKHTISKVRKTDEGRYHCLVENSFGNAPSNQAVLTLGEKPTILEQPASQTVKTEDPVSFSVKATGPAPLTYQWKKDDKDIPGATNPTLSLPRAQKADAGKYHCVVSSRFGKEISQKVDLKVE